MDPFTFVSLINTQSSSKRAAILESLKTQLGIASVAPTHFLGIPKVDARKAWLFPYKYDRKPDDVKRLWALYMDVMKGGELPELSFAEARSVKYAGTAKLTQAIFRAAPKRFFPVDGQTTSYLARLRLPNAYETAKEYQDICKQVREKVDRELFVQSHDAWFENQKTPSIEAKFQQAALQNATAESSKNFKEASGGIKLPPIRKMGSTGGYQRNPAVAAAAIRKARFKCEIDPEHETFVSKARGKPYVEAHHLVPLSNQAGFNVSLDVTANVVALCPTCHRLFHHGKEADKKPGLSQLFRNRTPLLKEKEILLTERELLKSYRGDILTEEV
jgi:5-methylcytosine-specific restriction enzyme A